MLIEELKPKKVYLIDPWTKLGEFFNFGGPYTNHGKLPTSLAKREAELRTARFSDVDVEIIEGFFLEEIGKIKEKLDWIYIDGSHKYDNVLKDLTGASKIINAAGRIFGDDWWPNPGSLHHGVFRAVQTFVRTTDYQIVAAGESPGQYCLRRTPTY